MTRTKGMTTFLRDLEEFYAREGRHDLPWRKTKDPYKILVSEIMLQQTQVARGLPYYKKFLDAFPTVETLAAAPRVEVLRVWQGLGYNRRAVFLHECAKAVVRDHNGRFPKTEEALRALPGIGPYTAAAVMTFAHNLPVVCIETNIRTVFTHHFFNDTDEVRDREILEVVAEALHTMKLSPCEFYAALMDYGSYLKARGVRINHRSAHYTKQSKFDGSLRQARGRILAVLLPAAHTEAVLVLALQELGIESERTRTALAKLLAEGVVEKKGRVYRVK